MSHPPYLLIRMVTGISSGCQRTGRERSLPGVAGTGDEGLEGVRGLNETGRMSAAGGSSRASLPVGAAPAVFPTHFALC